jgi:hypothetical protein
MRMMEGRNSPALTEKILYALYCTGQDGMPPLMAILKNSSDPRRAYVARLFIACDHLGTNRTLTVKLLSECVRDKDTDLAARATESLGWLRCEPDITVPALVDGLRDPRAEIRSGCFWSLARFETSAKAAVPELIVALQDTNRNMRIEATNALRKIAPDVLDQSLQVGKRWE